MKAWLITLFWVTLGCAERLDVGSNVLWYSDHETGDLSTWTEEELGGSYVNDENATCAISTDVTRSGKYSVKLTATAAGTDSATGLYRRFDAITEAYYSVWYYVPKAYETASTWTILRFRASAPDVPGSEILSLDLNLRSLKNGSLVLSVVEHRQAYLASPLALPTPIVPVGQWFQIEARFRSRSDETGGLKLWLDGRLVYDIKDRVTGQGDFVYFNPCNYVSAQPPTLTPSELTIYIDDVMVSLSRITEHGTP